MIGRARPRPSSRKINVLRRPNIRRRIALRMRRLLSVTHNVPRSDPAPAWLRYRCLPEECFFLLPMDVQRNTEGRGMMVDEEERGRKRGWDDYVVV